MAPNRTGAEAGVATLLRDTGLYGPRRHNACRRVCVGECCSGQRYLGLRVTAKPESGSIDR